MDVETFFLLVAIAASFLLYFLYKGASLRNERLEEMAKGFDNRQSKLNEYERALNRKKSELQKIADETEKTKEDIQVLSNNFQHSMLDGRKWLCKLLSVSITSEDKRAEYLRMKRPPALRSSEIVSQIRREKRELIEQVLFLESKIDTYKEYFPFLKNMEEEILEETIDISKLDKDSEYDRTKDYLSLDEYKKLSSSERNQLALDRFMNKTNKRGVGMLYELFLGHYYESKGYKVIYHGVEKEFADLGRDLICISDKRTLIVQAKCWARDKEIHENAVCQLFGTAIEYRSQHPLENVVPVLYLQCRLSERGKAFADALGVKYVESFELKKGTFPTIKCNINKDGLKIYHLPFDQQYRRTKIDKPGEFMATTVKEAEAAGFRRAFRYMPTA